MEEDMRNSAVSHVVYFCRRFASRNIVWFSVSSVWSPDLVSKTCLNTTSSPTSFSSNKSVES